MADSAAALASSPDAVPSVPSILGPGGAVYRRAEEAQETAAKKQEEIAKRFEGRRAGEEQEMETAYAGVEKALGRPRPGIPSQERVPSPPKPEDYQKMSMEYLGAMVLLGAFGGRFIRNAANAPLSAFAGAMKGWQEGNLEAYKNKSAEWEQKQKQVLENNRAKLEEYRTILEDRNASIQDQMFRVKMVAAKHQDKLMYDRTDADNFTGVAQAYEKMTSIQEKAEKTTQALVDQQTTINETAVERANQWKTYLATPQGQAEFNQLPPAQQFQMKGFVETYADQAPAAPAELEPPGPAGGSMPSEPPPGTELPAATAPTARMPPDLRGPTMEHDPKKAAFQQLRRETWAQHGREPTSSEIAIAERKMHAPRSAAGMSLQEFIEETRARTGEDPSSAEIRQFQADQAAQIAAGRTAGGRMGNIMVSSKEFANVLPLAAEASRAVPRVKFRPINVLLNNARLLRSDVAYQNLVDANEAAITAYSATMSRSGANSVHAQQRADRVLSTATSNEAYQAGLRMLQREVDAVERSPRDALDEIRRIFGPEGVEKGGTTGERYGKSGWAKEGDIDPMGLR